MKQIKEVPLVKNYDLFAQMDSNRWAEGHGYYFADESVANDPYRNTEVFSVIFTKEELENFIHCSLSELTDDHSCWNLFLGLKENAELCKKFNALPRVLDNLNEDKTDFRKYVNKYGETVKYKLHPSDKLSNSTDAYKELVQKRLGYSGKSVLCFFKIA